MAKGNSGTNTGGTRVTPQSRSRTANRAQRRAAQTRLLNEALNQGRRTERDIARMRRNLGMPRRAQRP